MGRNFAELQRCMIDVADEGICAIDAEDRTTFVNPKLTEMSGFPTEELLGRPVLDFVDERAQSVVREALKDIRRGIRGRCEVELSRKDGTKLWVLFSTSPLCRSGESYAGGVALVRDISPRKQVEDELRSSEQRLRMALSAAAQGLWDWDIVADRAYLSPEYLELTGTAETFVHPAFAWFQDAVHPDDRANVASTMAAHAEGSTPLSSVEFRLRRSTGEYLWVLGTGRIVARSDGGAPVRMLGIVTDISQQKKAQAELERAQQQEKRLRAELEQVTQAALTVSEAVASSPGPDISAVLSTLALQAQVLTGAKYAAAGIGTEPEKPFEPWVSLGMSPETVRALGRFPPRPVGLLGAVATQGRVIRVADVREHASLGGLPAGHPEMTSFLGVPLRHLNRPFGNLYVANKEGAAEFSAEDERKVEMLAARAAVAVQTARLYAGEAAGRAWLGTTIDQIPEGVVLLDRDGRLVAMNRAAGAFSCGARETGPLGNAAAFELRSPDGSPLPFEDYPLVRALKRGEVTLGRELLARRSDGRFVPILTNAAPVYDERGEISGATNLLQDITTMKELADELRASAARYRALVENSDDGILLGKPDGTVIAANPAACRILGRTEQEIRRVGRAGLLDPTDPGLEPALAERRRTRHVRAELRAVRGDGSKFPTELTSTVFVDAEGQEKTVIILRDRTEKQRDEDRLRVISDAGAVLGTTLESEAVFRELIKLVVPRLADCCLLDLMERGQLHRVGVSCRDGATEPVVAQMLEPDVPSAGDSGVMRVARTCEPELVSEVDDRLLRAAARDDAHYAALRSLRPRSIIFAPLVGRSGVLGVLTLALTERPATYDSYEPSDLVVARAIAARAALAIENARLYEQLAVSKRLREEVLAIVAHDLAAPLNVVSLLVRKLMREGDRHELHTMNRALVRGTHIISDLLVVASVEGGGTLPLNKELGSFREVVSEAVLLSKSAAAERALDLEVSVPDVLPPLLLDRDRVLRVLSNLLGNAIKFTPSGGHVWLSAAVHDSDLVVSVSNTGPGIEPAALELVFDRFWQSARAKSEGGVGLGLAIAKGIVEAHGGTIHAESIPHERTTFTFTLPLNAT